MKKILTILTLAIMFLLLFSFVFLPKESFSEIENRSLSVVPKFSVEEIINGKYMEKIENYITDHFPLRN